MNREKIQRLFKIYEEFLDGRELTFEEKEIFLDGYLLGVYEGKIKYKKWNNDK